MPRSLAEKIFRKVRRFILPFNNDRWIAKKALPALYLSKNYSKPGSLSFFGGSPLALPDFAWPVDDVLQMAKSFLGQIRLADLPEPLPHAMPREGILYFFLDLAMLDAGESPGNVAYVKEPRDLCVAEPPFPVPVYGDEPTHLHGGRTYGWRSAAWQPFLFDRFPKFDLTFLPFSDVASPLDDKWAELPDSYYVDQWVCDDIFRAMTLAYSEDKARLRERRHCSNYEISGALDERYMFYVREKKDGGLSPLHRQWPQAWDSIALGLSEFFNRTRYQGELIDTAPLAGFKAESEDWIARAKAQGFFTPVSADVREAFRAWVRKKQEIHYLAWKKDLDSSVESKAHHYVWATLEHNFNASAADAAALYAGSDHRDLLLDPAVQDDFLGMMEPSQPHQMFGYGFDYQYRPKECEGKLLLLQLNTDYSMFWMFADCGNIHFFIDPDDLAAGRFENVIVTIAGG